MSTDVSRDASILKPMMGKVGTLSFSRVAFSASTVLVAGLCLLILLAKALLVSRININWDEFFHLSHIYDAFRGEMTGIFQRAYVHAFQWLPGVGADEISEVRAGRIVAWIGLVATALLLVKLASRWTSTAAAWIAPLAFLTASPVLRHGASFRADSWLAPLFLLVLVLVTGKLGGARRILGAGAAFGISLAISVKAILMAPLVLCLLLTVDSAQSFAGQNVSPRQRFLLAVYFFGVSGIAAATVLVMHWLTLPSVAPGAIGGFAANAASTTLLDVPLLPRWDYLELTLHTDWVTWLLVFSGFAVAAFRFQRAALCILSLAPLLFYRNAFPYYYVVMLAPAAVLAAVAVGALQKLAERQSSTARANWVTIAASLPLALQAAINLDVLRFEDQDFQQLTVSAVHEIFPEPVPYIDHSGMIASFPKVNFFMSSWGVESYRERGVSFMERAIALHRPPMVLANSAVLMPGSPAFENLFELDRQYIERFYVPYWGAIRVAGAEGEVGEADELLLELPFSGRYRVETQRDVFIDGTRFADGDVFATPSGPGVHAVIVRPASEVDGHIRMIWSEANPPPEGWLPADAALYRGL